jgi:hypothetical protein
VSLTLALLVTGLVPAAGNPLDNLDFASGTLRGWEGNGFYVTSASRAGPSFQSAVSSSDREVPGSTGLLHRILVVPRNAGALRVRAYAQLGKNCRDLGKLDIVVLAAGKHILPKMIQGPNGWQKVEHVLPGNHGQTREYFWPISNYVGQTLRIALLDEDKRPGCHLYCTGFNIVSSDEFEAREFSRFMTKLARDHKLSQPSRFESKHFVALSNAEDEFTEMRLHNCELIYELFFDHFRGKGLRLHEPPGKLMVAIFDSQAGFEAYLGHKMPSAVTGIYEKNTNRLLVYDYAANESFVAFKKNVQAEGRRIGSELDRQRFVETENRRAREFRTGVNIGTVMHEVAHHLSFNTGMLNRDGDVPVWLAEGLACYCESTDNMAWQGIGEPNPERLAALAGPANGQGRFIPLQNLIKDDDWLRKASNAETVLLGYAESWALFRLLMDERPQQMRRYLALLYSRRVPDARVPDFCEAFGSDLPRLELRLGEYMKGLVERYYRPRK